ncbi:hypothetical protein HHI36_004167 [Cryptolaemus montrouzieri]|uniref:Trehalase n=1 Tax=Cryptolaemus montrouzieri TaxID=559131 RepID=A0ABD2NRZ6_9CUCU
MIVLTRATCRIFLIIVTMTQLTMTIDPSDVFCKGILLHTVQMARVFEDSKTFVDMKMKYPAQKILERFGNFMAKFHQNPSKHQVKQFVIDNFDRNDTEFRKWNPKDWKEEPEFLKRIPNSNYRKFGIALHKTWKKLGRRITKQVKNEIDRFSLIWVPNPVIVPGGRFREFYYWDSYWIIKGLIISGMTTTVRGMLDNYLYVVDKYGYIPNGGRLYYVGRSQPPMLIPSFKLYMDAKGDLEYLNKSILTLEKEFDFWLTKRTKTVKLDDKEYIMATYGDDSSGPRPESYAEDVDIASTLEKDEIKETFFTEMKAACESGIDFSSRWFIANSTNKGSLLDIKTTSIIPVDLNAFLYGNAVILSEFHQQLQNFERADYYRNLADRWLEAVERVLWHEEIGTWLDYDLINGVRRDYFYASNLAPLWTGCYNRKYEEEIVEKNLNYLDHKNIFNFPGGIPNSLEHTGEQWDFPNAWSPQQHMIIFGLKGTKNTEAQRVARELATKWLASNYEAYVRTKNMAEKYDCTIVGESGGGGEYKVQFGFGWSNGVILDILVNFFSEN